MFQSDSPPPQPEDNWLAIYFDLAAPPDAQESQFVALAPDQVDPERHFPLSTLFNTVEYRKANATRSDAIIERIDRMQEIFKEAKIPVQTSETEDRATVAIIFERVNRQGVKLDTLQLLSAWTWSEDFQLQDQFQELADELSPFGFADLGDDTNLLLRCCSAILKGDASPQALMSLNGTDVRRDFEKVTNGIKYAVDYLRNNYRAEKLDNLPFTTLLVPLSVFFAVSGTKQAKCNDAQRKRIDQWFWRSSFSRRYSSAVLRNLNTDIAEMRLLRDSGDSNLGEFSFDISSDYFKTNIFKIGSVNTKTFILLLASRLPRTFISGQPIDLATTLKSANRTEFHHLMPRAYLKTNYNGNLDDSTLANFAFLSRSDNNEIGGVAPSTYRAMMPSDITSILEGAITSETLFTDDYEKFVEGRTEQLLEVARALCA